MSSLPETIRPLHGVLSRRWWALSVLVLVGILTPQRLFASEAVRAAMREVGGASFRSFSIDQGLSQSEVTTMIMDRDGFMWLGTQDGLNRYDGYHFEIFRHDPRNPNTLSGNLIHSLSEDKNGSIWVLSNGPTLDEVNRLTGEVKPLELPVFSQQTENNRVISYFLNDSNELIVSTLFGAIYRVRLSDRHVDTVVQPSLKAINSHDLMPHHSLAEDAQHRIWYFLNRGELARIAPDGKRENVRFKGGTAGAQLDSSEPLSIGCIVRDRQGNLWILSSRGLLRWDALKDEVAPFLLPYEMMAGDRKQLATMLKLSSSGELWVGTTDGLFAVDTESLTAARYTCDDEFPSEHRAISVVHEARDGSLWVGTSNFGLHRVERKTRKIIHYHDWRVPGLVQSGSPIGMIISDRADNLWLSGASRLWQVRRERDTFFNILHDESDNSGLSHPVVWTVKETRNGDVWVGTYDGNLNRIMKDGTTRVYPPPPVTEIQPFRRMPVKQVEEPNGHLWVPRRTGELAMLDPETGQYSAPDVSIEMRGGEVISRQNIGGRIFRLVPDSVLEFRDQSILGLPSVLHMYRDKTGRLWMMTAAGIWYLDEPSRCFKMLRAGVDGITLTDAATTTYTEDEQGRLILAKGADILRYDPRSMKLERLPIATQFSKLGGGVEVMSLHYQKGGVLWIGTLGEGLYRVNLNTGELKLLTMSDGLPNNTVYNILQDDIGSLWMSTNRGLVRLNPVSLQTQVIDGDAGLQSDEFNEGAADYGPSGHLYFGGIRGLTRFKPSNVMLNPHPPSVVVTGFKRFDNTEALATDSEGSNVVSITHRDNYVTFEFVALDFTEPEHNHYRYRLEGFDQEWRETNGQRAASYTNLPGGNYVFRVQASNNSNVWNEVGTQVALTVIPPPWKTWWAYALYVCSLVGLIAAYVRVQQHKLERERAINEQLRRVDLLKDEFLANTSHELRTPLNGIIGIAESLMDGATGALPEAVTKNLSMIASSGRRLSHLINDILDFSRLKNRDLALDLKPISVQPLAEIVVTLARPLLGNKPVTIHNDLTLDLPSVMADENRLQQILHNLIGNAVKFTEKGVIRIYAIRHGDFLQITVSDSGIGIPADKMEDIFKSFEQVDGSISRRYGGTGLGLAITRQLVELHGGKLWVESVLGMGSSFVMRLPISSPNSSCLGALFEPEERPNEETEALKKLTAVNRVREEIIPGVIQLGNEEGKEHRFRILLVDDEPVNLQVLVNHLSLKQYHLTLASSGAEALERIADQPRFDLVILDVMMPGMSGFEVCRRLREHTLPSELPVVLLTARNQIADLVEGFNAGANDYLTKPVSKHELMVRTRMHLQLSKLNAAYSRFVPREFLEHLALDSILDVQLGDHVLKEMTVLFSDIRSFTALSEQMSPEENFRFVNSYLERMEPVIRHHRGFIDKYIGDAIMALFSGTADDALRAAISMLVALDDYNQGRNRAGYVPIRIGIGLNTGNLMLGTVGGPARMDGTVISDAVNLASRIEGLTKMYGASILITEKTRARLSHVNEFSMRLVDRVVVKGRTEPVAIYEVFDGDTASLRSGKLTSLESWNLAQQLYEGGEFLGASDAFTICLKLCPGDTAAELYLERCKTALGLSRSSSWNAVTVMDHK